MGVGFHHRRCQRCSFHFAVNEVQASNPFDYYWWYRHLHIPLAGYLRGSGLGLDMRINAKAEIRRGVIDATQ